MGSFSMTCAISNLGIGWGDEVYYMLLNENPYKDSLKCYVSDLWYPRTLPILAKYNDYGSIEGEESGFIKKAWMEDIKLDLLEQDWGENKCHDIPTSRDMKFKDLLTAVWEDRLRYVRDPIAITPGPFKIGQAMIRKDVWDNLCKIDFEEPAYEFYQCNRLENTKKRISQAWENSLKLEKIKEPFSIKAMNLKDEIKVAFGYGEQRYPFGTGISTQFKQMVQWSDKLSQKETDLFLKRTAELQYIEYVMSTTRLMWKPSHSNGPQCPEWEAHQKVLDVFQNVVTQALKEEEE